MYKPTAGVRPLWDFAADTLAAREVLTYRVAQAMGVDVVPETRCAEGPLGAGAAQRFVAAGSRIRSSGHGDRGPTTPCGRWLVLDLVANNADRKLGHLLGEAGTGRLWAIDHGLTFHPQPKLRTVLWGFAGRAVFPRPSVQALERLRRRPRTRDWPPRSPALPERPRLPRCRRRVRALSAPSRSTLRRLATGTPSPGPRTESPGHPRPIGLTPSTQALGSRSDQGDCD